MADRYYVDTTAYLCILLGERGHRRLLKELEGGELLSSILLILESKRTLIRLGREEALSPDELQECLDLTEQNREVFLLRDLTLDLCTGTTMPVVSTPRSLDLAHLRTALWFHERESLTRFVSLDGPQVQAAREFGLPV